MVRINGEDKTDSAIIGMTLSEYLVYANYNPKGVVIERNLEIIHKENFNEVRIADGDSIEVLMFMGGG